MSFAERPKTVPRQVVGGVPGRLVSGPSAVSFTRIPLSGAASSSLSSRSSNKDVHDNNNTKENDGGRSNRFGFHKDSQPAAAVEKHGPKMVSSGIPAGLRSPLSPYKLNTTTTEAASSSTLSMGAGMNDMLFLEDVYDDEKPLEIVSSEVSQEMTAALANKIIAKKFDFKQREEQQMALIKLLRKVLGQVKEQVEKGQKDVMTIVDEKKALKRQQKMLALSKSQIESKVKHTEEEVGRLQLLTKTLQKNASDLKIQYQSGQQELMTALTAQEETQVRCNELDYKVKELECQLQAQEIELKGLRERHKRQEDENAELKAKIDSKGRELTQAIATFQSAQTFHQERTLSLQNQTDELMTAKHELALELREVRSELSQVKTLLANAQAIVKNLEEDLTVARAREEELKEEKSSLQKHLESTKVVLMETNTLLSAAQSDIRQLQGQLAAEKAAKEQVKQERDIAHVKIENLSAQLTDKAAELTKTILELETTKHAFLTAKDEWALQKEDMKEKFNAEKVEFLNTLAAAEERRTREQLELTEKFYNDMRVNNEKHDGEIETLREAHREELTVQAAAFAGEKADMEVKYGDLQGRYETMLVEKQTLAESLAKKMAEIDTFIMENNTLKKHAGYTQEKSLEMICSLEVENKSLKQRCVRQEELEQELTQSSGLVAELQAAMFTSEATRRRLHNMIQELKGNIRVICRVRPFLSHDQESEYRTIECAADERSLKLHMNGVEKSYGYQFDRVFAPGSSQEAVFDEVSQLVQSALDGYDVCLFSYGQTGSGKTHTMTGGAQAHAGIIPRAVAKIIEQAQFLSKQGWNYNIEVSFSEIYNDKLFDLLSKGGESKLDIKQTMEGKVNVPGITKVAMTNANEVDKLLAKAMKNRSTAFTDMNERSSRSHCVFTLYLTGTNAEKGVQIAGTLNLCDLAGSERLERSQATGDRLKETQAINKSLSALSEVFINLTKNSSHIPYRNSTLTHLLKDCFGGDGKTMMILNLSPTNGSCHESLCSLRFAANVNKVDLGTAKKNVSKTATTAASSSSTMTITDASSFSTSASVSDVSTSEDAPTVDTPFHGLSSSSASSSSTSSSSFSLSVPSSSHMRASSHDSILDTSASSSSSSSSSFSSTSSFTKATGPLSRGAADITARLTATAKPRFGVSASASGSSLGTRPSTAEMPAAKKTKK